MRRARADYHTHTPLCKHADGEPQAYLEKVMEAGLAEYGVADHSPYPALNDGCRMEVSEWGRYKQIIEDLRASAPRGLQIRFGMELDWFPGQMLEVYELIRREPFDYLIGSVHYLDGLAFDHPMHKAELSRTEAANRIWTRYVEELYAMIESGCADIIGHADLPKKFGYFADKTVMKRVYNAFYDCFKTAGTKGMALDLNTSGWRREVKECYPSPELLKMAAECGMGICLGSDAHAPEEIACRFDDAVALARSCGFTRLTLFDRRTPFTLPLE